MEIIRFYSKELNKEIEIKTQKPYRLAKKINSFLLEDNNIDINNANKNWDIKDLKLSWSKMIELQEILVLWMSNLLETDLDLLTEDWFNEISKEINKVLDKNEETKKK